MDIDMNPESSAVGAENFTLTTPEMRKAINQPHLKDLAKNNDDIEGLINLAGALQRTGKNPKKELDRIFGSPKAKSYTNQENYSHWYYSLKSPGDLAITSEAYIKMLELQSQRPWEKTLPEDQQMFTKMEKFINSLGINEKMAFIKATQTAMEQSIPPEFGIEFFDYDQIIDECDFSKPGLERFSSNEIKVGWLHFSGHSWLKNPSAIKTNSADFSEALSKNSQGEAADPLLYDAASFSIKEFIGHMYKIHKELGMDNTAIKRVIIGIQHAHFKDIPESGSIISESLEAMDKFNTAPYPEVFKGDHPDIAGISRERLDGDDRTRISIELSLRDVFTPLCMELSEKVKELSPKQLEQLESSFVNPPFRAEYIHNSRELQREARHLEAYGQTPYEKQLYMVYDQAQRSTDLKKIVTPEIQFMNPSHAPHEAEKFVWADSETAYNEALTSIAICPVGEYGEDFAERLARTARIMAKIAENQVKSQAADVDFQNKNLLRQATARGSDAFSETTEETLPLHTTAAQDSPAALNALQEGILSIAGAISLYTAQKIPGYDTGDKVLEAFVDQGIPNHIALHIPMGYLMPKVWGGRYFDHPLSITDKGKLVFSDSYRQELQKDKDNYQKHVKKARLPKSVNDAEGIENLGHGCPVGRKGHEFKDSGIGTLTKAFLYVYKALETADQQPLKNAA